MKILEIIISETPDTDRAIRNTARHVMNSIMKDGVNLEHGAVIMGTRHGDIAFPFGYIPTMFNDLAIGLGIGVGGDAYILKINKHPSTLPSNYRYIIMFPCYSISDYIQFMMKEQGIEGQNITMEEAITLLPRSLENALTVDLGMTNKPFLISLLKREPESFIHEFSHYSDFVRARKPESITSISPKNDRKSYFNTPTERNAYYNQVFAKMDSYNKQWYQRPFREVAADFTKTLQREFTRNLEPKYMNRLLQRFYQVWVQKNQEQ